MSLPSKYEFSVPNVDRVTDPDRLHRALRDIRDQLLKISSDTVVLSKQNGAALNTVAVNLAAVTGTVNQITSPTNPAAPGQPGGGGAPPPPGAFTLVANETPGGTVDGSNVTFTLVQAPTTGTLQLYRNGVRQVSPGDFSLSTLTITMVEAPVLGDTLLADYQI